MKSTRESLWAVEPGDRPREKLERLGAAGLSDAELVALVLGSGMPGVNVLDSAASLLAQAGGVHELMVMTVRELKALMGVGVATAGRVVAVAELWRRAHDPLPGLLIEQPHDIVTLVRAFVAQRTGPPGIADSAAPLGTPAAATYVVVADHELRVLVVVPLARSDGEAISSLVPRVLHEVLYRGGSAFALAVVEHPEPDCTCGAGGCDDPTSCVGCDDPTSCVGTLSVGTVGVRASGGDDELRALRDVLKLAAGTVGLRYLSTVTIAGSAWEVID